MQPMPGLYLAALLLWFLPLLAYRSEMQFLTGFDNLPRAQWRLSAALFLAFVGLNLTLFFHTAFSNVIWFFTVVLLWGLVLLVLAGILLTTRMRLFRDLTRKRREERRDLVREASDLVREARRDRIRAKYGEDG